MTKVSRFRSTEWLAEHLSAPDVVVVDGSWFLPNEKRNANAEYKEAHIPGAVFLDIDVVRDETSDLPHMMPSTVAFSSHMRKLGIGDGQTIVVYDGSGLFAAARVWWMFRAFGVQRVFILEGGMPQWVKEGRRVEAGEVKRPPRHFTPRLNHGVIADLHDVSQALAKSSAQIVDARPADRFAGAAPEPRAGVKSGHMPGAFNVPFPEIVKNGKLIEGEALKAAFVAAGVDLSKPIITSCGSGVSAAILWLALDSIGSTPKALYDGSWAEWGSTDGCVVEVS
jgi:thiosulfate/3-mercaptopyruvate sulfurtransferase